MADTVSKNLGVITAYGMAVQGGYTGTKQQFYALLGTLDLHTITDLQSTTVDITVTQPNTHYHFGILSSFTLNGIQDSDYETTFQWVSNASGCSMILPLNVDTSLTENPLPNKRYLLTIKNRVAISINIG